MELKEKLKRFIAGENPGIKSMEWRLIHDVLPSGSQDAKPMKMIREEGREKLSISKNYAFKLTKGLEEKGVVKKIGEGYYADKRALRGVDESTFYLLIGALMVGIGVLSWWNIPLIFFGVLIVLASRLFVYVYRE